MIKKISILIVLVLCTSSLSWAQKFALKSDIVQWATTTPNLSGEVSLAPRLSLVLSGANNPWTFSDNKKFKHWKVESELKYWLWESFNGHFFSVGGQYAQYNTGGIRLPFGLLPSWGDSRYQGDMYGAGFSYGYQWMLSPRWGFEAQVGFGYQRYTYRQYECRTCGLPVDSSGYPVGQSPVQTKHYFGPTKLALSFIYIIR